MGIYPPTVVRHQYSGIMCISSGITHYWKELSALKQNRYLARNYGAVSFGIIQFGLLTAWFVTSIDLALSDALDPTTGMLEIMNSLTLLHQRLIGCHMQALL